MAVLEEWDSAIAHLVEVDVTGEAPRVLRVVIAADVGLPINPKSSVWHVRAHPRRHQARRSRAA